MRQISPPDLPDTQKRAWHGRNLGSDVATILEVLSEGCPRSRQNTLFRERVRSIMTAALTVLVEASERSGHGVTRGMIVGFKICGNWIAY